MKHRKWKKVGEIKWPEPDPAVLKDYELEKEDAPKRHQLEALKDYKRIPR